MTLRRRIAALEREAPELDDPNRPLLISFVDPVETGSPTQEVGAALILGKPGVVLREEGQTEQAFLDSLDILTETDLNANGGVVLSKVGDA